MSGNQQDVLIVLIRQTHRAQEDAKGTMVYIQNEAHTPQKPLQGLDRNPGQYWTEPLIDTMTQGQWQHTQQYTTTYVYVVVGAYACCHLSRYIVSVMSCTLVLSPQLFLHHSESQYSTECFNLMSDYDLRIPYFRSTYL